MVKEFACHIAWTEVIREGCKFVGLVEYQRRVPWAMVHELCVVGPYLNDENDAEIAATSLLENIKEITECDDIIYNDRVIV